MGSEWLAIVPTDALWIVTALVLGLVAKAARVPPLVGFLAAGFLLNAASVAASPFLEEAAALGITLMLFTVGLHLSVTVFTRPEVWGVALVHVVLFGTVMSAFIWVLVVLAVGPLAGLDPASSAVLGVALAFSSTVFAAKTLEAKGAQRSRHGRIAMGVLIIQDIIAVVFLVIVSADARPSPWAVALLALPLLRTPLRRTMQLCGHGELLLLFGVVCALGGAALFESVGVKGDLGALSIGLLLAGPAKSEELGKLLDGFKDLFLAGFFVTVGLTAPLSVDGLLLGLILMLALPLKAGGFFALFSAARLRARTAWQSALDLTTFSEFGLIVVSAAVAEALLPGEILAAVAVAVAGSLIVASPFALHADDLFTRWREPLRAWQRPKRLRGDEDLHLRPVKVIVFGLGRLGSAVMATVEREFSGRVLGVDVDEAVVAKRRADGRYVVTGDATEAEFWSRTENLLEHLEWVLLTMSSHEANVAAVMQLRSRGYAGRIVATSRYSDQAAELRELGANAVFDVYTEAGAGFAADLERRLEGYETNVLDLGEWMRPEDDDGPGRR